MKNTILGALLILIAFGASAREELPKAAGEKADARTQQAVIAADAVGWMQK